MKFNDKEKFIGFGILIIILGLSLSLYVINLPDDSNISITQEDISTSSKGNLVGKVINMFNLDNLKQDNNIKDYCGDGFCSIGEDCFLCSSDCGECLKVNLCGNSICDLEPIHIDRLSK